jgi:hypothetical protein
VVWKELERKAVVAEIPGPAWPAMQRRTYTNHITENYTIQKCLED